MAILHAVDQWRHYLQMAEFVIKTDQKSMVHLEDQRMSTVWQHKAFTKLLGLQYRICYKKGEDNKAADALSRRHHGQQETALSITECKPAWLTEVQQGYAEDVQCQKLLTSLATTPRQGAFTLQQGLLRYKGRLWLGQNRALQTKITSALHDAATGGHSGYPVTLARVKQHFAWPGMRRTIKEFVRTCSICQQAKPDRACYPGLLQPLPIPSQPWELATMDFIDGLPPSGRYNCIMVVVDKLTKYSHFVPLVHPFTAQIVAQQFMDHIYKHHGMPRYIISDRDPLFTSRFWQHLFKLTSTELLMSMARHPQTDGQTERVNQCLETFLRCYSQASPQQWSKWLSLAEFWYNTSTHSSLGKSPFAVLYGREPRTLGIVTEDNCQPLDVRAWLEERQLMLELVKQHLHRAQQRMKEQARRSSVPEAPALRPDLHCAASMPQAVLQIFWSFPDSSQDWGSGLPFATPRRLSSPSGLPCVTTQGGSPPARRPDQHAAG